MNKRGILGLIAIIIIIVLIAGSGYIYFKFIGNGVQVGTGNVAFDITLNKTNYQEQPQDKTENNNEGNKTQNNTDEVISIGDSDEEQSSQSPPGHPGVNTLSPEQ